MESKIQGDYHKWLWNTYPSTRGLCYSIPNGGKRGAVEAAQLKATGVIAGIPDYCHAIPAGGYAALYIEFKDTGKINTGKLSEHEERQLKRQEALKAAGNAVAVCDTLEGAQGAILNYLKGTKWIINQ